MCCSTAPIATVCVVPLLPLQQYVLFHCSHYNSMCCSTAPITTVCVVPLLPLQQYILFHCSHYNSMCCSTVVGQCLIAERGLLQKKTHLNAFCIEHRCFEKLTQEAYRNRNHSTLIGRGPCCGGSVAITSDQISRLLNIIMLWIANRQETKTGWNSLWKTSSKRNMYNFDRYADQKTILKCFSLSLSLSLSLSPPLSLSLWFCNHILFHPCTQMNHWFKFVYSPGWLGSKHQLTS